MIGLQFALLDPRQQPDRADGVLIDGVVVVHVVLHLRDDPAEVGHEAPEHPGLVHPAQHRLGVALRGQHLEEQRVGARVAADTLVDEHAIARGLPHRQRVDLKAVGVGEVEQFDEPHRVLAEEVVRRHPYASAGQREAVELRRAALQRR